MLDYWIINLIICFNLVIYLTVTLPLDFVTYRGNENSRVKETRPEIKHNLSTILAYTTSLIIWMLFLIIPFENLVNSNILYHPLFANVSFFGVGLQLVGLFLISSATIIALGGRISRGKRAFSWGVPIILEKNGMYRYLRHPLYASYFYYFVGFLFLLQNFLLIFLLLGIPGYYDMAVYEEEILIQEFGHEYIEYQKRTKMFIPFVW